MDNKTEIPEFDFKPDYIMVKLLIMSMFCPFMYGVFKNYFPPFMYLAWVPIAMLLSAALFFLGRLSSRLVMKERVPYDPENTIRDYVKVSKSWLGFVVSAAVGIAFFYLAYGMKTWFLTDFDDGTTPHSTGYVYEAVCAAYGFAVTYFSSLIWFVPDGLVLTAGNTRAFDFVSPVAMLILPIMFSGVPRNIVLFYDAIFILILVIRNSRISSYNKMVEKIERRQKYEGHVSKFDK